MNSKLIIPQKLKAGFQKRDDTYQGKLAFVIYKDIKNVWRKETSWNGWVQLPNQEVFSHWADGNTRVYKTFGDEMTPVEFDNVPTEGFVLNKKVGGHSSGWNHRSTYARVYDPRGWEFEISVPNLLYLIQETDILKGKGIVGEMVYAWHGKDLVLLPCNSPDYQSSLDFNALQTQKVAKKDLVVGYTYRTKKGGNVVYLGEHLAWTKLRDQYLYLDVSNSGGSVKKSKQALFFDLEDEQCKSLEASKLATLVSAEFNPSTADFLVSLEKSGNKGFPFISESGDSYRKNIIEINGEYFHIHKAERISGRNYWDRGVSGIAFKLEFTSDSITLSEASYGLVRGKVPNLLLQISGEPKNLTVVI